MAAAQHDAHFGSFAGGGDAGGVPGAKSRDCTHWCMPSGALDTWSELFFNLLCNVAYS
jgi:hypothetical protein